MKTLHLTLEYRWYDMIERGEKPEEYRDMKWLNRIGNRCKGCATRSCLGHPKLQWPVPTDYTHVCLHRGYTRNTMLCSIFDVTIGMGKPEWGAPDKECVIIKLKEREDGSSRERLI